MTEKKEFKKIREILTREQTIPLAIVFGSLASGQDTPKSDLDLAIAGEQALLLDDMLKINAALSAELGREVDLIDLHQAHGALLQEILTRGVLLINVQPALYEKFIKRMLAEKEDDSRVAAQAISERMRRWSRQTKR